MEMEWENHEKEIQEPMSSVSVQRPSSGLTFRGLQLSQFERQMITGNRCEAFLEMKCVFHSDSTDVFYDTDRYLRMDEVLKSGVTGVEAVMDLCTGFLEAIRICGEYLLSPEDLSFQDEMIYCSGDFSTVKLMYIPGYHNETSIRDKLVDLIDTAIEYDEQEEDIYYFSEYKKRLYMEGKDLRSLTIITEEMIRKKRQAQERLESVLPEEIPDRKKRGKGVSVKWSGHPSGSSQGGNVGESSEFLMEDSARYEKKGNQKDRKNSSAGLGTKLKSLFNDLVS